MSGPRETTIRKWRVFAEAYILLKSPAAAAKEAGYKGNNLSVVASRLLQKPGVQEIITSIRDGIKSTPTPITPAVAEYIERENKSSEKRIIDIEDKRALLWEIACRNGKVVTREDIEVEVDDKGCTTRIITRTERVFDSQGAINAVLAMSQIDGDLKAPGASKGGGITIEGLLLSIGR